MARKTVPRKRYVLIAVEAGYDQPTANRTMREISASLPADARVHMTTVEALPPVLARFARVR